MKKASAVPVVSELRRYHVGKPVLVWTDQLRPAGVSSTRPVGLVARTRNVWVPFASAEYVVGDWNGDGTDTIGVFRSGVFYLRNTNTTGVGDVTAGFGNPTDRPVVGDWNGDGTDTIGVSRGATFYLRNTNTTGTGELSASFGDPSDWPIVGDWNGDHIDTIGIVRRG